MKILTFWYVACALFCFYSLQNVVEERYEVEYLAKIRNETEPIRLACKGLSSLRLNKTEMSLEELRKDLYEHFNSSNDYDLGRKMDSSKFEELVLNQVKTGSYFIFNDMVCFVSKTATEDIVFSLLIYSVEYFVFKNSTVDFIKMIELSKLDQLVVLKKGHPYSNCDIGNSRFRQLNECFKRRFRLSRYFYDGNESGPIHLNLPTNLSVENEKSCFNEFQRENCKIVQLTPITFDRKTTTLEAQPKLSRFDFWIQFIGLVCSFANISLNQLASIGIKFAISKVNKRKVRITLVYLKWAVFILSLACCGYLYTTMILEHKAKERDPPRKEIARNHIKQKVVHLVICVDLQKYFTSNPYYLDLKRINKTMPEIEKVTERTLNDHLEGIYVSYHGKMFRMNNTPEPKVLFRFVSKKLNRCFSFLIRPDYQVMSSNPQLTIMLKKLGPKSYLLTKNENLNEKTFQSFGYQFKKRTVKRLKSSGNCIDYQKKYGTCTSRLHCIESCINKEMIKKFENITTYNPIIDKDQFSSEEWSKAYLMEFPSQNQSTHDEIKKKCEKIPDKLACVERSFENTVQNVKFNLFTLKMEIDLSLEVELSIEEISLFNILLNILNIQSIFFGMTMLKLLKVLYRFIKPKLRIRSDKIALFLIYLVISIGFSWHTYAILDLSINGDLTYNQYYEVANRIQMPVVVFCRQMDENRIDKNHKMTGSYLEDLTSNTTTESLFTNIAYLSESNEWTPFNLSLVDRFFFMSFKCFRIRIAQEYDKNQFHFSAASNQVLKVLKVNFTKKFVDPKTQSQTVYFMTKTNETDEFSNVVTLDYKYGGFASKDTYLVDQSELKVSYKNHLGFIKRYFSTLNEDDFSTLGEQLSELKGNEYNFKTLKTLLEEDDFDYELNDDLFDQFFSQVQNVTTRNLLNLLDNSDDQETFVVNHLKREASESDLTFSLILIKKTLLAVNEENFARLVLNLLNVLFIWFDLGILDLHPGFLYFRDYLLVLLPLYILAKINQILHFCCKWLKKLEPLLYELIDPRKRKACEARRF